MVPLQPLIIRIKEKGMGKKRKYNRGKKILILLLLIYTGRPVYI